jgi:hypothetical protein
MSGHEAAQLKRLIPSGVIEVDHLLSVTGRVSRQLGSMSEMVHYIPFPFTIIIYYYPLIYLST